MVVVEVLHHYLLFPQLYFIVRKLYSRKVPGATILLFKSLGFQINIRIPICSSVLQAFLTSGFSCFFSSNRVSELFNVNSLGFKNIIKEDEACGKIMNVTTLNHKA